MPPRVSRSSLKGARPSKPQSNPRKPKKSAKRALDAFAIASHETSDYPKISKHRLGESDVSSRRKRQRNDSDGESGEDDEEPKRRRQRKGGDDEMSFDEDSDSEGNNWTMGHVEDDDDSDIDSDEAFGESDEERFDGWTFRGSSTTKKQDPKKGKAKKQVKAAEDFDMDGDFDLNEDDSEEEEDEDEDDLGEDAIDLATALDQYEESDNEQDKKKKKPKERSVEENGDFLSEDDESSDSSSEDEDEISRASKLQNLISSLPEEEESTTGTRKNQRAALESAAPSEFAVTRKVDLASFKPKVSDPEKKKSLKLLQDDVKSSKRNDIARKLDAPLPKRQQDKIDRIAANEKANDTLARWTDTVKQNRRAEHLQFPLQHPNAGSAFGETRLVPTTSSAPANDLEGTIQSILQQSGLSNGKDDGEDQIQKWEELQTNKLPLEEVEKRRAELRRQRDLLFREEVRAKRIKKIKSKAYRRVHRKERERLLQKERDALKADGVDISEDEREYNDRRRAEERMGAKHRESKWAKGIKASGRSVWDEDARDGVTEMARRNEELRRRIEGKEVRDEDEDHSDFSDEEEEDDDDEDGALQKSLGRLQNPFSTNADLSHLGKIGQMKFMQNAEAARKAQNDETVRQMKKELAGEESDSDEGDENTARIGRMKYGPGAKPAITTRATRSEFEERSGSEDEGDSKSRKALKSSGFIPAGSTERSENPFITKAPKESAKPSKATEALLDAHNAISTSHEKQSAKAKAKAGKKSKSKSSDDELPPAIVSAPDADGWQTVTYGNDSDGDSDEGVDLDFVQSNQALTAQAFAGDQDVEADFAKEKKAQVDEEAPQETVTTLPGWGSWTGEGLSKRANKRGQKTVTRKSGVDPSKRKDAKLGDRVIINQKKVKANSKFLATSLPFPFESKEQYERSLRLPQGPEWTTKQTFQDATKPRVIVKQGVIRPLHKPMV
ncbi:Utp14-domain-containing protein [Aaosphaeria arxii CBS 175.79]|uniref:Utp14-domain-containing protein n=1 Tax=Aaosphaeria arxii CBS 175.79 TaxID=1450172 RepID=A0A6A5Y896_9PLEO|nr:Utp14-domain-containing protein [Aaosphaeria arxii CBS 175.79]KAF2021040.1 Utp14-domain-containing protein [Aaosphaeria arxii CBS 175.79]